MASRAGEEPCWLTFLPKDDLDLGIALLMSSFSCRHRRLPIALSACSARETNDNDDEDEDEDGGDNRSIPPKESGGDEQGRRDRGREERTA